MTGSSAIYRPAGKNDIGAMAAIRAREWGLPDFWEDRISRYLDGEHNPQKALAPRAGYVAVEEENVLGFVAGHLTRRYACDGELQWINVSPERRGCGIASELLRRMAGWFLEQGALRVCVNVDPDNTAARAFYTRNGAVRLNPHWLVWDDFGRLLK